MTARNFSYRIRFSKKGDLRFISHHDLMRLWERALRRAELPVEMSKGFNPRPRTSYPIALELGVTGLHEVLDVRFTQWLRPTEMQAWLNGVLPDGVRVKTVRSIGRRDPTRVDHTCYRVHLLPGHRVSPTVLEELMARNHIPVQRVRRGKTIEKDIRSFIRELRLTEPDQLEMLLNFTPQGTARATEVLEALGCRRGRDYLINEIVRVRVTFVSPT